ncbi:MAG TPA: hypothetical protein VE338_04810 [Ktedonobacterales bacterium]|jgi:hypothetical protein|nr:hypothetical protein [Ktedonobacterales bacterium]
MAQSANGAPGYGAPGSDLETTTAQGLAIASADNEKALPLPGWLTKLYFIFPIVLYLPDAIFNYYVYSDGIATQSSSMAGQVFWSVVWGFVAIGVVGMAYLLSVLAPWHWSQNHRFQAFFCAVGVVIATVITTWNSLAFRSQHFVDFPTDKWASAIWPQLQTFNFSVTMVLVSVAPPFWGLFWAIVQPTEKNRDLRHLQNTHAERVLKTQQEAELKRIKAEANATVREAQLRGMAQTAVAAREQAVGFLGQRRGGQAGALNAGDESARAIEAPQGDDSDADSLPALSAPDVATVISAPATEHEPTRLFTPNPRHDLAGAGRAAREMYNHAAPTTTLARPEPIGARAAMSQPPLLNDAMPDTLAGVADADVASSWPARPRPNVGAGIAAFFPSDNDGMTGTTGPRPAIRRGAEPSQLLRTMNEPHARTIEQVDEVVSELRASGIQPVQRDVVARLRERYTLDEATARKMATIYKTAKKENRG